MGSRTRAVSHIYGGVRGFVAQHLTEKGAGRVEEKWGDSNFAPRGHAAAERGAKAGAHPNSDAPLKARKVPGTCPVGQ
jgi:hypothetical protein